MEFLKAIKTRYIIKAESPSVGRRIKILKGPYKGKTFKILDDDGMSLLIKDNKFGGEWVIKNSENGMWKFVY
jgi:hypothetical protein